MFLGNINYARHSFHIYNLHLYFLPKIEWYENVLDLITQKRGSFRQFLSQYQNKKGEKKINENIKLDYVGSKDATTEQKDSHEC